VQEDINTVVPTCLARRPEVRSLALFLFARTRLLARLRSAARAHALDHRVFTSYNTRLDPPTSNTLHPTSPPPPHVPSPPPRHTPQPQPTRPQYVHAQLAKPRLMPPVHTISHPIPHPPPPTYTPYLRTLVPLRQAQCHVDDGFRFCYRGAEWRRLHGPECLYRRRHDVEARCGSSSRNASARDTTRCVYETEESGHVD
jgi:hypothetical protein